MNHRATDRDGDSDSNMATSLDLPSTRMFHTYPSLFVTLLATKYLLS